MPRIWKIELYGIVVKYCSDMLMNSEGALNFGLFLVEDRNGATISDKERAIEVWAEYFENFLEKI